LPAPAPPPPGLVWTPQKAAPNACVNAAVLERSPTGRYRQWRPLRVPRRGTRRLRSCQLPPPGSLGGPPEEWASASPCTDESISLSCVLGARDSLPTLCSTSTRCAAGEEYPTETAHVVSKELDLAKKYIEALILSLSGPRNSPIGIGSSSRGVIVVGVLWRCGAAKPQSTVCSPVHQKPPCREQE
jgi:hypothetical protein